MGTSTTAKRHYTMRKMVKCGLFAALTSVLTLITIPLPSGVPITLQTFAIALSGYMLGVKYGAVSTGVYISLGALGMPVFSGARGGVAVLAGSTGGFIFGFLPLAVLCGFGIWLAKSHSSNRIRAAVAILLGIAGIAVCHALGTAQFAFLTGRGFFEAAAVVSIPYLAKDVASIVGAYFIALRLCRVNV